MRALLAAVAVMALSAVPKFATIHRDNLMQDLTASNFRSGILHAACRGCFPLTAPTQIRCACSRSNTRISPSPI
jgi:hypothetical protein